MAKKQTRRSISVSRTTDERLKAFCETSGISMSQFVETRVGDFLGEDSGVVSASTVGLGLDPAPRAPGPGAPGGPATAGAHAPRRRPAAPGPRAAPGPDDLGRCAVRGRAAAADHQEGRQRRPRRRRCRRPTRSSRSDSSGTTRALPEGSAAVARRIRPAPWVRAAGAASDGLEAVRAHVPPRWPTTAAINGGYVTAALRWRRAALRGGRARCRAVNRAAARRAT